MPDPRRGVAPRRRLRREDFPRFWSLAAVTAVLPAWSWSSRCGCVRSAAHCASTSGCRITCCARLPTNGLPGGPGYDWIARVGAPGVVVGAHGVHAGVGRGTAATSYGALFTAVTPGLAFLLAEEVVKPLVGRGSDNVWMFPSGTVTVVAASVVATVILVYRWSGRTGAIVASLALAAIPLGMCAAVIVLQWHYATDALGGLALGGAVAFAVAGVLAAFEEGGPDESHVPAR